MLPLMEKIKLMIFFVYRATCTKSGLCEAQAAQELRFGTECGASKMVCIDLVIGCFIIIIQHSRTNVNQTQVN